MDELNAVSTSAQLLPSSSKVSLSSQNLQELEFFLSVPEKITRAGRTYDVMGTRAFKFVVESGRVSGVFQVSSEELNTISNHCLTKSQNAELQGILSSASLCKAQIDPDKICTQALVPAYARIVTASADYDLGAATDGCGTNSVDLCGTERDLLRGFIQHVNSQLPTLLCN